MQYPEFLAGQTLTAALLASAQPRTVQVASDQSFTTSTFADITDLGLSVEAGASYVFQGQIAYASNATADFKISRTLPTGATVMWGFVGPTGGFTSTTATSVNMAFGSTMPPTYDVGGTSTVPIVFQGVLTVGSTAGAFQLQAAQGTTNASAASVKSGSYLTMQRTA